MGLNVTIRSVSSPNPNLYNSLKYYIVTYVYIQVIASDALIAYVHSDPVDEAKVVYKPWSPVEVMCDPTE